MKTHQQELYHFCAVLCCAHWLREEFSLIVMIFDHNYNSESIKSTLFYLFYEEFSNKHFVELDLFLLTPNVLLEVMLFGKRACV